MYKKENKLPFTLLSDEKGEIAKKFGVPAGPGGQITKEIEGAKQILKRGATIKRWTFVIGKDGKIVYKNEKANAAKDSKQVLDVLGKLK